MICGQYFPCEKQARIAYEINVKDWKSSYIVGDILIFANGNISNT